MVENTLYILTSAGSFRYNVEGAGTPNPYRIKPLVGVKLPLNSSYSPEIEIHNPHPSTIQVLEMYSSGGDLHLELPSGGNEADTALWQIPPYHTKQVMRASRVILLPKHVLRQLETPPGSLIVPRENSRLYMVIHCT